LTHAAGIIAARKGGGGQEVVCCGSTAGGVSGRHPSASELETTVSESHPQHACLPLFIMRLVRFSWPHRACHAVDDVVTLLGVMDCQVDVVHADCDACKIQIC
jgi:hypothetical protein